MASTPRFDYNSFIKGTQHERKDDIVPEKDEEKPTAITHHQPIHLIRTQELVLECLAIGSPHSAQQPGAGVLCEVFEFELHRLAAGQSSHGGPP